jgi:glycosyltransferase involved in cell wall biosynthesis
MLRIALTHAHCWPEVRRGGERYLHELAGALRRRGHRVTIIAGASRWSLRREEGVRVLRIQRSTKGGVLSAERRFGAEVVPILAAGRFDVVHSLGARDAAGALAARRVSKHRTVYTCLGLPVGEFWAQRPDGTAHQRVVDETDVYGCLSRYAMTCLQNDFGREGALTPGGVRLDRFRPSERTDTPTLLYSGALDEPRKGVSALLEALAIAAAREPQLRLWLTGSGDPTAMIEQAPAAARSRTEWLGTGSLDELSRRYASAWATVLPSKNEAFGLVLVESLASGTPIVAGDHASLPELIEPSIGAKASPEDPQALADACLAAVELARDAATAERCRELARRHDWDEAVAPAIEALYLGSGRDSTS